MDYKSKSVETLSEKLKTNIVEFEYTKKDGTTRRAKGTLLKEYLPEKNPTSIVRKHITFPKEAIDALMEAKDIPSLKEYAEPNGLVFVGEMNIEGSLSYVFKLKNENENLLSYYDLEKNSFRSFLKDNFLGIIEVS